MLQGGNGKVKFDRRCKCSHIFTLGIRGFNVTKYYGAEFGSVFSLLIVFLCDLDRHTTLWKKYKVSFINFVDLPLFK